MGFVCNEVTLANQEPRGNIISVYKHMGINVEMWKSQLETEFGAQEGCEV